MNSKKLLFGIMTALALTATSCINAGARMVSDSSKGERVSKTVKIGDFDEIETSMGVDVIFTQKANPGTAKVEISGDMADRLQVKCEGGTLKLYFSSGNNNFSFFNFNSNSGPAVVRVSSPRLDRIKASSSGSVTVEGDLKCTGELQVKASSSGDVKLDNVTCSSLDIECSSSGSVNVETLSGNLEADASSSGDILIYSVKGKKLEADASSSATINIKNVVCDVIEANAQSCAEVYLKRIKCDILEAEAYSSGDVVVDGTCRVFREDYGSSGKVKHSGLQVNR